MHTLYMHIYILLKSRMYSTKPRAEGGRTTVQIPR